MAATCSHFPAEEQAVTPIGTGIAPTRVSSLAGPKKSWRTGCFCLDGRLDWIQSPRLPGEITLYLKATTDAFEPGTSDIGECSMRNVGWLGNWIKDVDILGWQSSTVGCVFFNSWVWFDHFYLISASIASCIICAHTNCRSIYHDLECWSSNFAFANRQVWTLSR